MAFNFFSSKKSNKEALIKDANLYLERIKKDKNIPIISSRLLLESDEKAFLEEAVSCYETRAVRKNRGGFGGLRIIKGVNIGGYSGQSESDQEWRLVDSGTLTLTNKRLVFDGEKSNKFFVLSKIISVESFLKSIRLSSDGKTKDVEFSVNNPITWALLINVAKQVKNPLDLSGVNLDVTLQ